MTKKFTQGRRHPLFNPNGNHMLGQKIPLSSGGSLGIDGGDVSRIYLNTRGTFWTPMALEEAIAELLFIKEEWETHRDNIGFTAEGDAERHGVEEERVEDFEEEIEAAGPARINWNVGDRNDLINQWLRPQVFGGPENEPGEEDPEMLDEGPDIDEDEEEINPPF